MPSVENPLTGLQSSRRNLIRISALLASAIIARTTPVFAANYNINNNDNNDNNNNDNNNNNKHTKDNNGRSCFLKGTTIRTVEGAIKIEDLAIGDLLPTVFGGICPIQWIGRYRFKRSDPTKPWVKNVLPVRVCSVGPWPRCSACRFVCHRVPRIADRWRAGGGRPPNQRHHDYTL
jgi:hypothetical protein